MGPTPPPAVVTIAREPNGRMLVQAVVHRPRPDAAWIKVGDSGGHVLAYARGQPSWAADDDADIVGEALHVIAGALAHDIAQLDAAVAALGDVIGGPVAVLRWVASIQAAAAPSLAA